MHLNFVAVSELTHVNSSFMSRTTVWVSLEYLQFMLVLKYLFHKSFLCSEFEKMYLIFFSILIDGSCCYNRKEDNCKYKDCS